MKVLSRIVGGLLILSGIVAGLYVGVWIFLIGGIDNIGNGLSKPADGWRVLRGILEIFPLAEILGGICFFVLAGSGALLMNRKWCSRMLRRVITFFCD